MSPEQLNALLSEFIPHDGLSDQYLERIAEHAEIMTLGKGKLIFQRGKAAPYRYYLIEGTVDLLDSGFQSTIVTSGSERAKHTLDDSSPTQVSAVAKSPVRLLKVDSEFLDVAMAWSQTSGENTPDTAAEDEITDINLSAAQVEVVENDTDWMSSLLQSPLFFKVSPAHIQTLFGRFQRVAVKQGQAIIKEGESGDYFYVIESGQARVTNLTGDIDVILEPGQFFGEEALVGNAPRNASITMHTDGCLMRLEEADFKALLQEPVQQFVSFSDLGSFEKSGYQLLDVRLPLEFRHQHVPGSRNIALASLRDKLAELDAGIKYVVTDDAGRRSQVAAYLLCQKGFDAVILEGADQYY